MLTSVCCAGRHHLPINETKYISVIISPVTQSGCAWRMDTPRSPPAWHFCVIGVYAWWCRWSSFTWESTAHLINIEWNGWFSTDKSNIKCSPPSCWLTDIVISQHYVSGSGAYICIWYLGSEQNIFILMRSFFFLVRRHTVASNRTPDIIGCCSDVDTLCERSHDENGKQSMSRRFAPARLIVSGIDYIINDTVVAGAPTRRQPLRQSERLCDIAFLYYRRRFRRSILARKCRDGAGWYSGWMAYCRGDISRRREAASWWRHAHI